MATDAAPDTSPPPRAVEPPAPLAPPVAPVGALKLSAELAQLVTVFATREVTLREVINVLAGRAYNLLMLLLALPFLLPIPIPGLSGVLGVIVAIIAARLMIGQRPWLPATIMDRSLPPKFFPTLLNGAGRILRGFETLLRPRYLWIMTPPLPQLHAAMIFIAAFVLLLPLPPGTNLPPALVIVVFAAGLLERDGLFILAGYLVFALNVVFFSAFYFYGEKLIRYLWHLCFG